MYGISSVPLSPLTSTEAMARRDSLARVIAREIVFSRGVPIEHLFNAYEDTDIRCSLI